MNLLGSTKNKIAKDKNGKNVPHLEIIILVTKIINKIQESYIYLFLLHCLVNYYISLLKILYF